jgi:hypothetical protein
MQATITFAAFEDEPRSVGPVDLDAQDDKVLSEAFERFNHAIPGVTGDLAEKHETRSMSVGDVITLHGDTDRIFVCEGCGWTEITEKGLQTWLNEVPRRNRSMGVDFAQEQGIDVEAA